MKEEIRTWLLRLAKEMVRRHSIGLPEKPEGSLEEEGEGGTYSVQLETEEGLWMDEIVHDLCEKLLKELDKYLPVMFSDEAIKVMRTITAYYDGIKQHNKAVIADWFRFEIVINVGKGRKQIDPHAIKYRDELSLHDFVENFVKEIEELQRNIPQMSMDDLKKHARALLFTIKVINPSAHISQSYINALRSTGDIQRLPELWAIGMRLFNMLIEELEDIGSIRYAGDVETYLLSAQTFYEELGEWEKQKIAESVLDDVYEADSEARYEDIPDLVEDVLEEYKEDVRRLREELKNARDMDTIRKYTQVAYDTLSEIRVPKLTDEEEFVLRHYRIIG